MQALRASMASSAMASIAPCRHGPLMASTARQAPHKFIDAFDHLSGPNLFDEDIAYSSLADMSYAVPSSADSLVSVARGIYSRGRLLRPFFTAV